MNVKLGELKLAEKSLQEIGELKLPPKSSIHIARMARKVKNELNTLEEQRQKLVKDIGVTDESGNVKVPDEKMGEFIERMNEMMSVEVEVDVTPITEDMLGTVEVKPNDLMKLGPLFAS